MKTQSLGLLAALSLAGVARAEPPPAALMPQGIAGSGWSVLNIDAARDWYIDKLGMKLLSTYSRDGKPFEYIMGYAGSPDTAILALLASPKRPTGPNVMSRIILKVSDARALAAHLAKQGIATREVVPGVAYFLSDPEGNPIELYTPPTMISRGGIPAIRDRFWGGG